jgi:dihydrofolate reductase
MAELICELIVTLDGFARGERSPGYYGYSGPEFDAWMRTNETAPHRTLIGRKTYEMLDALPEDQRDEGWKRMADTPGYLFSRTLETAEWPNLEVVHKDCVDFVGGLKRQNGPELRTLGSVSLVQQLLAAGLVDCLKLIVCPLVLPKTGVEPIFEGVPDLAFDLRSSKVLDNRVLVLEYQPSGPPAYAA